VNPVVVLGATGSVGRQTLDVAEHLGIPVLGLASGGPSSGIADLASRFPDARVAIAGGTSDERAFLKSQLGDRVAFGTDAVVVLAGLPGVTVMNGIVGSAGLAATFAALRSGNRLALANKESLVAAGDLVRAALVAGGGELIPVDSEHSALHQLLAGVDSAEVDTLMLTASGGPFRGRKLEELHDVTPDQALEHPTWDMGGRITIDSATLVNKGLEVIEATVLFDMALDRVEVVVHPQSLVHSLVRLTDGAMFAHVGHADMRVPIQYSLTFPDRRDVGLPRFDLAGRSLTFEEPDMDAFPGLGLAYAAVRHGGGMPAVYNAADEVAVAAFFQHRLGFTGIPTIIESTMNQIDSTQISDLDEVLDLDRRARVLAASLVAGAC
jgi:1-deoxy-D-xylulose-5-phosphate reductoisomerase